MAMYMQYVCPCHPLGPCYIALPLLLSSSGNVSSKCPDLVRQGWHELVDGANNGSAARAIITAAMGLCNPLPNADAAENVAGWVEGALETMTQYGAYGMVASSVGRMAGSVASVGSACCRGAAEDEETEADAEQHSLTHTLPR